MAIQHQKLVKTKQKPISRESSPRRGTETRAGQSARRALVHERLDLARKLHRLCAKGEGKRERRCPSKEVTYVIK